jgi:hypothetical protein
MTESDENQKPVDRKRVAMTLLAVSSATMIAGFYGLGAHGELTDDETFSLVIQGLSILLLAVSGTAAALAIRIWRDA